MMPVASNSNRRKLIVLARRLNLDDELTSRDRHRRRDRRYQRSIGDTFPYRSDAEEPEMCWMVRMMMTVKCQCSVRRRMKITTG